MEIHICVSWRRFWNFLFFKKIYLFLERGERREKERERNIDWLPLTHPNRRPGPKSRHVP